MKLLLNYRFLIPFALVVGLAPFPFKAEPHLVEKLKMLAAGTLSRPIDIFDLFWHLLPLSLLSFNFGRDIGSRYLATRQQ